MKNLVLPLTLLALASSPASAQWVLQPFTFTSAPTAFTQQIDIVDAQTVWALGLGRNGPIPRVVRTTDGGATWTQATVSVPGSTGESPRNIKGLSASTALICGVSSTGWRILKTVDGGATWTKRTTTGQFASPDSYTNFFAMFGATEGICIGDAIPTTGNRFEMYRTLDAGDTWTAIDTTAVPKVLAGEIAIDVFSAQVGNHFWFHTSKGRVFHSRDKGQTWTVGTTGLVYPPPVNERNGSIAFRDTLNGLVRVPALNALARTSDGGATWQPVTTTGPVHRLIAAVPGTNHYLSAGEGTDAGSAISTDNGTTWTALETTRSHYDLLALSATVAWSAAVSFTGTTRTGALGFYQLDPNVLGTPALTTLPAGALRVFPNPSADGRFSLALAAGQQAESLTVRDALGRAVLTRAWSSGDGYVLCEELDLRTQAPGFYTLEVRTSHGVTQQQLVRQ